MPSVCKSLSVSLLAVLLFTGMAFAQTESVLYSFDSNSASDGFGPISNLVRDAQGNLYGTTIFGGSCANECGIAFQLTPPGTSGGTWTETVIHTFGVASTDGSSPRAGLIADSKGN